MSAGFWAFAGLRFVLLLVWAWLLLRACLGIARRAGLARPVLQVQGMLGWLKAPEHAPERRRLAALTALLVVLEAVNLTWLLL